MRGLYAIVDLDTLGRAKTDPVAFTRELLKAGPAAMQLRAKTQGAGVVLAVARDIARLAAAADVPFFVNDRADLAELAGATGVHLGQHDLPAAAVRELAPSLRIGISTHTEAELSAALSLRPSYVAFGPIFPTATKQDAEATVGLDGLERALELARAQGVPLVAIGGIDASRAPLVARRADMAAVISGLGTELAEAAQRATELQRVLGSGS